MSEPDEETTPDQRRQAGVIPQLAKPPVTPMGARESINRKLTSLGQQPEPEATGDNGGVKPTFSERISEIVANLDEGGD